MFAKMGGIFKHLISVNLVWSLARLLDPKVICMHKKQDWGYLYFRNLRRNGDLDVNNLWF